MATKSKQGTVQLSPIHFGYVDADNTLLPLHVLLGNEPRLSGRRTGKDKVFLKSNDGKLKVLSEA